MPSLRCLTALGLFAAIGAAMAIGLAVSTAPARHAEAVRAVANLSQTAVSPRSPKLPTTPLPPVSKPLFHTTPCAATGPATHSPTVHAASLTPSSPQRGTVAAGVTRPQPSRIVPNTSAAGRKNPAARSLDIAILDESAEPGLAKPRDPGSFVDRDLPGAPRNQSPTAQARLNLDGSLACALGFYRAVNKPHYPSTNQARPIAGRCGPRSTSRSKPRRRSACVLSRTFRNSQSVRQRNRRMRTRRQRTVRPRRQRPLPSIAWPSSIPTSNRRPRTLQTSPRLNRQSTRPSRRSI